MLFVKPFRNCLFEGIETQVISYVRSFGKLFSAGIGNPVAIDEVEFLKTPKEEIKSTNDLVSHHW